MWVLELLDTVDYFLKLKAGTSKARDALNMTESDSISPTFGAEEKIIFVEEQKIKFYFYLNLFTMYLK